MCPRQSSVRMARMLARNASIVLWSHLNRSQRFSMTGKTFGMKQLWEFDGYRLDGDRRVLLKGTDVVQLPSKAFDILLVLVRRRGEVVSKDELMEAVWPDSFVEEANLSQNVHLVRKAFGEKAQENRYVATLPGRGYSFVADTRQISDSEDSTSDGDMQRFLPIPGPQLVRPKGVLERIGTYVRTRTRRIALVAAVIMTLTAVFIGLHSIARYYNNQGVALQKDGYIKQAIVSYQKALLLAPSYAEAHYNLGDAYEELPAYDKAVEEYQKAIESDPTLYESYNNLARLYIKRRRDYEAALDLLDRALKLDPKEPAVQYSLYKNYGWANFELHLAGQAEASLRRAIALDGSRGAAHCLLAKVLDVQENHGAAFKEWESCAAYSGQTEVEPEWRAEAEERLNKEAQK